MSKLTEWITAEREEFSRDKLGYTMTAAFTLLGIAEVGYGLVAERPIPFLAGSVVTVFGFDAWKNPYNHG